MRMLQSLREQDFRSGDEVIVVSDDNHLEVIQTLEPFRTSGLPLQHITITDGPHRDWGHTPRNRTIKVPIADFVRHADDDNIFLPGAVDQMRMACAANPTALHMFPIFYHRGGYISGYAGLTGEIAHFKVDTATLVYPRVATVGEWWTSRSGGDYDFIKAVVAANPKRNIDWHGDAHYAYLSHDWSYVDTLADINRLMSNADPYYALVPLKSAWTDLSQQFGSDGRVDVNAGWHQALVHYCADKNVIDIGSGLGAIKGRFGNVAASILTQDIASGLSVDIADPIERIPSACTEVVTAFNVLEHVVDDQVFISGLCRIAVDLVIIVTANWLVSRARNPYCCREYTPTQLCALFDSYEIVAYWIGNDGGSVARQVPCAEFLNHTEPQQALVIKIGKT